MSLTREQILAARPLPMEEVHVPEFGGSIFVRTMTSTERDRYEQTIFELSRTGEHLANARARLVAFTACDADGKLIFALDDIEALGRMNGATLDRLAIAAQKVNQLGGNS